MGKTRAIDPVCVVLLSFVQKKVFVTAILAR